MYANQSPGMGVDPWGLYTVYWGGAGVQNNPPYVNHQIRVLGNFGIENVKSSNRGGYDSSLPKGSSFNNMGFDAIAVNNYRYYPPKLAGVPTFERELVFDPDPFDFKDSCALYEQTNYIGYSYGSLLASHTAMYYANRDRVIDNLVLIGSPIDKSFLTKLQNHENIKNVFIINLTEHGDPIYAGMSQKELIKGVLKLGEDFKDGATEGHFYYSPDSKEGRKRRRQLAFQLYQLGLR